MDELIGTIGAVIGNLIGKYWHNKSKRDKKEKSNKEPQNVSANSEQTNVTKDSKEKNHKKNRASRMANSFKNSAKNLVECIANNLDKLPRGKNSNKERQR